MPASAYNGPEMRPTKEMARTRGGVGLSASVPAGVFATVIMDVVMVCASRAFGDAFASDKIGPEMIGRWAGGLGCGRRREPAHGRRSCRTTDITTEPRLRGEFCIGLAVHYLTGITLTQAYLVLLRRSGLKPSVASGVVLATTYGLATGVLPLLIMYPSMGYGCCGRRSGDAARLLRIMLLGHAAFGAGIGLSTVLPGRRAVSG
jgi:hypothetical protein